MRGVIYARYSPGPHQTEQSIEGQVADCQQYAEEHGIDIIEIYADRHVSGKSIVGRDEFQRMLRDAEKGRFDCVLVWKIDRFGRDRQDIAMGKMALKRAGVKLMYARESVPEGPEGIILESVLEGLAEYYSADLRQKVIRGMKETAKKGQYCGQSLPIGYKVDAERHIVVDEREAAVVREAFKLHIAGGQIRDIVQLFADRGIMGRRGKPVSNAVVYRMLRNEKYLGEFYIQDVKLNVEPIIDQATFLEAARHFKTSRNNAAGRAKVNYLLSCKMFCGYCGSMISAEAGTGKLGKVYRYYKCGDKKRGKKCELKPFPKDHLEDAIILATVNDMLTDEMIEKLTVRILEVQEQENADDPVVGLRRRLDSNKKRQRNLLDAIEEGGARGLVSRLAALEEEEERLVLEIQRAEIKRPRLTHEVVEAWLRSFRVGDVTDDDFRARLVDTFIARVELRNDEALIFYNIREKGPHSRVRVRPEWWNKKQVKIYFVKCFPIICNEVLIGVGNMVINVVLGRQSEQAIAAIAVFRTLEGMVISFFAGFSNAASVLVGTCVGSGELDAAYERAKRLVFLCGGTILCVCLVLLGIHKPLLSAMSLSGESMEIGSHMLMIYCVAAVIRMCNWVQNDTYRAAGDAAFGTIREIAFMYAMVLPLVCLTGLVWKAPFLVVFACCYIDEPIRLILMQRHMYSGKWVRPVTPQGMEALSAFMEKHGRHKKAA